MKVILLDALVVDGLVEGDEASREVADEENDHDGAEHQSLSVLICRMLSVSCCSHWA